MSNLSGRGVSLGWLIWLVQIIMHLLALLIGITMQIINFLGQRDVIISIAIVMILIPPIITALHIILYSYILVSIPLFLMFTNGWLVFWAFTRRER